MDKVKLEFSINRAINIVSLTFTMMDRNYGNSLI